MKLEEACRLDQELWTWIAENKATDKDEWPKWNEVIEEHGEPYSKCFMCEYAKEKCIEEQSDPTWGICIYCPIDWERSNHYLGDCADCSILYSRWKSAVEEKDMDKASEVAQIMANLPLKQEYKEALK